MNLICHNGKYIPTTEPVIRASSPGFKWGDGLFETIRVHAGRMPLDGLHQERLFSGMRLLQMNLQDIVWERTRQDILDLCDRNHCLDSARVRLAVYREDLQNTGYLIEAIALDPAPEVGKIDIYPLARKSMDAFSNLKSSSFLPYVMASRYAIEKNLNDALVLNTSNFICDSSRANIFLVKNREVFTPALHQGCVAGVMRRYLVENLHKSGYGIHQAEITQQQLEEADEVFLTNAVRGLQPVAAFRDKKYGNVFSQKIRQDLVDPLFL